MSVSIVSREDLLIWMERQEISLNLGPSPWFVVRARYDILIWFAGFPSASAAQKYVREYEQDKQQIDVFSFLTQVTKG